MLVTNRSLQTLRVDDNPIHGQPIATALRDAWARRARWLRAAQRGAVDDGAVDDDAFAPRKAWSLSLNGRLTASSRRRRRRRRRRS